MKSRLSIKNKLLGYFGGILAVGLLFNGIVATYLGQDIMKSRIEENLVRLVIDCADKVNIILEHKKEDIQSVCEIPELGDENVGIDKKLALLENLNRHMEFEDVAYVTPEGKIYGISGYRGEFAWNFKLESVLKGETVYSGAKESQGENLFSIAAPVRSGSGEVTGILMGVETVESFTHIIDSAGITEKFMILDSEGNMVGHSDRNVLNNQKPMKEMLYDEEFHDVYNIYQNMLQGKTGSQLYKNPDTDEVNIISYAPVANGWSIALMNSANVVFEPVMLFYRVVAFSTFIIILIGILATYLISKNLASNINDIANYLGEVAKGDFNQPIPEELLGKQDEMGDVARALKGVKFEIEEMLSTVRECTEYMNDQMEDFTGDIKDALKEVVTSQSISTEEAVDVLDRIDHLSRITDFINESSTNKKAK